jgi:signal transduction histidine kinase
MRRRLILVFLAVSLQLTIAFVLPLGFLVERTAEDRAVDTARSAAAAMVPVLVADGSRSQIESAVESTVPGREGRMTVITSQGWTIGPPIEPSQRGRVDAALSAGASAIGDVDDGVEVVSAVATGSGELSAIRVHVPESELGRGTLRAWATLAGVAVALIGISVVIADRLSRSIVRPAQDLASAARRLGEGDLGAVVRPSGPAELVELGGAFNDLGSRVSSMLDREREFVAELSHRLRTPLTKLRMRVDQVTDSDLASALRADVDDLSTAVSDIIRETRGTLADRPSSDVVQVVTDRAEFWRVLAEDQNRPWRLDRGAETANVPIAASDLAAAVDVLLDNAFTHTAEGIAVTVGSAVADGVAKIWVEDSGIGVHPGVVERGASTIGSTGLGLDIARRTAENAGGSLEVGPSDLGGTKATLSLPVLDDPVH